MTAGMKYDTIRKPRREHGSGGKLPRKKIIKNNEKIIIVVGGALHRHYSKLLEKDSFISVRKLLIVRRIGYAIQLAPAGMKYDTARKLCRKNATIQSL